MKAIVHKIEKSKIKGNHILTIHIPSWDLYFGCDSNCWQKKHLSIGYTYIIVNESETRQQFIKSYLSDVSNSFAFAGKKYRHKEYMKKAKLIKKLLLRVEKMEKNNGKT